MANATHDPRGVEINLFSLAGFTASLIVVVPPSIG
jgi:hypothetical protein